MRLILSFSNAYWKNVFFNETGKFSGKFRDIETNEIAYSILIGDLVGKNFVWQNYYL